MSALASQITSLAVVCWTIYSGAGQRKHQSSASLAFVMGINRWPVNSPHKGLVTRKMSPFDDVIMYTLIKDLNSCKDCTAIMFTWSWFQTCVPHWNEHGAYVVVLSGVVLICINFSCHKGCLLWHRVRTNSLASLHLIFWMTESFKT